MLMTMPLPSKGQTLSGQRKGYVPRHMPARHCFLLTCRLVLICSSFVAQSASHGHLSLSGFSCLLCILRVATLVLSDGNAWQV